MKMVKMEVRYIEAAKLFAAGLNGVEVAVQLGVSSSAVNNWKANPKFQKEVEWRIQQREEIFQSELVELIALIPPTLREILLYGKYMERLGALDRIAKLNGLYIERVETRDLTGEKFLEIIGNASNGNGSDVQRRVGSSSDMGARSNGGGSKERIKRFRRLAITNLRKEPEEVSEDPSSSVGEDQPSKRSRRLCE